MSTNRLMDNYGWVQNTSNLSTIRNTLELVDEFGIRHLELRERIRAYREEIGDLPKRWSWDARCRIKAICACGLVTLDRNIQGYILTDIGKELLKTPKSDVFFKGKRVLNDDEIKVFRKGLLTNVPVNRLLNLFKEDMDNLNQGLSKYDIGKKLGFVGDEGFTHLNPQWIVANNYSFQNKEGDADKWARTIISWLRQVNWVVISENSRMISGKRLATYKGTDLLNNVLRYDAKRIPRHVPSEMLCSNKHAFPNTVQYRRVKLLELLQSEKTINQLCSELQSFNIIIDEKMVKYEIINLTQAGSNIKYDGMLYKLTDRIILDVDSSIVNNENEIVNDIEIKIEEAVVKYESTIPPRLVDNLIRYGNDKSKGKDFESTVSDYFTFLGYETTYLGQGKGRVADVLAKYRDRNYHNSYALIVDTKATEHKYNFPVSDIRKMKEYIMNHGKELLIDLIPNHAFSFISSKFTDNYLTKLQEISLETSVDGCCIETNTMLELAHAVRTGQVSIANLYNQYITNDKFQLP